MLSIVVLVQRLIVNLSLFLMMTVMLFAGNVVKRKRGRILPRKDPISVVIVPLVKIVGTKESVGFMLKKN
jgi:hypothetical protein